MMATDAPQGKGKKKADSKEGASMGSQIKQQAHQKNEHSSTQRKKSKTEQAVASSEVNPVATENEQSAAHTVIRRKNPKPEIVEQKPEEHSVIRRKTPKPEIVEQKSEEHTVIRRKTPKPDLPSTPSEDIPIPLVEQQAELSNAVQEEELIDSFKGHVESSPEHARRSTAKHFAERSEEVPLQKPAPQRSMRSLALPVVELDSPFISQQAEPMVEQAAPQRSTRSFALPVVELDDHRDSFSVDPTLERTTSQRAVRPRDLPVVQFEDYWDDRSTQRETDHGARAISDRNAHATTDFDAHATIDFDAYATTGHGVSATTDFDAHATTDHGLSATTDLNARSASDRKSRRAADPSGRRATDRSSRTATDRSARTTSEPSARRSTGSRRAQRDRTTDRTANRTADRTTDRTTDRTADRAADRTADRATGRTADRTADRQRSRSTDRKKGTRRKKSPVLLIFGIACFIIAAIIGGSLIYRYVTADSQYKVFFEISGLKITLLPGDRVDPETEIEDLEGIDWDALRELSPDIVGWIAIPGTIVNYPIVQGRDNDFYLTHLADKTYSDVGAIFLDYLNDPAINGMNNFIYGHNLIDGRMFAILKQYRNREFFNEHKKVFLSTPGMNYELEVIACLVCDADDSIRQFSFSGRSDFERYVNFLLSYKVLSDVTAGEIPEKIYCFITCTDTNYAKRTIVLAKVVDEQVPKGANTP